MQELFGWSSIGLGAASVLFVCVLIARRVNLAHAGRRRREAEARLHPLALGLLEYGTAPDLDGERELEIFAGILGRYARHVRGDAREAIAGFFERTGGIEREIEALDDRRPWRRAAAVYALGEMGSRSAVAASLTPLGDPSRDVRAAAARSLGRLGADVAVEPLVRALVDETVPHGAAAHALLEIGEAALQSLRELAHHRDPDLRAAAADLLGVIGEPTDTPLLVGRLRDSSAEVRASAARALGRLAAEEAAGEVRSALKDRVPFVRAAAANALGAIADSSAATELLEIAQADAYDAAQAAARALARVDGAMLAAAARARPGPHVAEAADRAAAGL